MSIELMNDNLERRKKSLCFVQRHQNVYKKIETVVEGKKEKRIEYKFVRTNYLDHANDRTDRDICTECGNAIMFGTLNRKVEDLIE